jgi:hypothetical protein
MASREKPTVRKTLTVMATGYEAGYPQSHGAGKLHEQL